MIELKNTRYRRPIAMGSLFLGLILVVVALYETRQRQKVVAGDIRPQINSSVSSIDVTPENRKSDGNLSKAADSINPPSNVSEQGIDTRIDDDSGTTQQICEREIENDASIRKKMSQQKPNGTSSEINNLSFSCDALGKDWFRNSYGNVLPAYHLRGIMTNSSPGISPVLSIACSYDKGKIGMMVLINKIDLSAESAAIQPGETVLLKSAFIYGNGQHEQINSEWKVIGPPDEHGYYHVFLIDDDTPKTVARIVRSTVVLIDDVHDLKGGSPIVALEPGGLNLFRFDKDCHIDENGNLIGEE